MEIRNIFAGVPAGRLEAEDVVELLRAPGVRLERIVSTGQTTGWLVAEAAEWVVVLRGAARLEFEGGAGAALGPGDCLVIPARCRHRVAWTDPAEATVWLALHYAAP